jgi:predicted RNA-binding Zn-ribbon protein involved in translation (DUF1610 family)
MSIFENAIYAIQAGVEDFAKGTEGRLQSSVRNVHAGVLLLFKHKLKEMSPSESNEALLKQRIEPVLRDGKVMFEGKGKKTADVQTTKERFRSLGVDVDWKVFDSVGKIRNDIEHYYTDAKLLTIKEALSKLFVVARDFAKSQLRTDLRDHLSPDAWQQLTDINEFYDTEYQLCRNSIEQFESASEYALEHAGEFTCPDCFSDLILFSEKGAVCRAWDKTWDEDIELAVVAQAGSDDQFTAAKDGDEETVINCPDCGAFGFVDSEARCVSCEGTSETECQRCGIDIPASEIDGSGYCGW